MVSRLFQCVSELISLHSDQSLELTWSRTHGIHTNSERDLLIMQTTSEGNDGTFARRVIEKVGTADVSIHGGVVDNDIAALHVLEGILGHVEVWMDVCVEGLEPLLSVGSF